MSVSGHSSAPLLYTGGELTKQHFRTEAGWDAWLVLLEELRNSRPGALARVCALFDLDDTVFVANADTELPFTDERRWDDVVLDDRFIRCFELLARKVALFGYLTGRETRQLRNFGLLVPGAYGLTQFGMQLSRNGVDFDLVGVPPIREKLLARLREMASSKPWAGRISLEPKRHVLGVHFLEKKDEEPLFNELRKLARQMSPDLACQVGNLIVEIGPAGVTKGNSYKGFIQFTEDPELKPRVYFYVDDSTTGKGAFDVQDEQRVRGVHVLKGCSDPENRVMVEASDLVIDGIPGTLKLVTLMYDAALGR